MEIELKDFLEGTQKGISDAPAESEPIEIVKSLIRVKLKDETKTGYSDSCKLIRVILQNIIKNPDDDKYRTIKLSNAKFSQLVARFESGMEILQMLGFEVVNDDEPFILYAHKDIENLVEVVKVIDKIIDGEGKCKKVEVVVKPVVSRVKKNENKEKNVADQLAEYRKLQKSKGPSQKSLENRAVVETPCLVNNQGYVPPAVSNSFVNPEVDFRNICIRVFELTNYFRVNQGLQALVWNEQLCNIAVEHSRNMAEGKVPFGHEDYKKRYKRFPFKSVKGGAENVAFNNGFADPGRVCVDGWMQSTPHRANIMGKFNTMAVGVWGNTQGYIYITQLFALV